jgi:hypothetical protein
MALITKYDDAYLGVGPAPRSNHVIAPLLRNEKPRELTAEKKS